MQELNTQEIEMASGGFLLIAGGLAVVGGFGKLINCILHPQRPPHNGGGWNRPPHHGGGWGSC